MRTITIQGLEFSVNGRYAEGHVLTAPEANQLNQTYVEALRNNFAPKIKKLIAGKEAKILEQLNADRAEDEKLKELPEGTPAPGISPDEVEALQEEFAEYAASFEFAQRSGTRAVVDPVEKEAYKIAKTTLTAHFKQKGVDIKSIPEDKLEKMLEAVASKPEVRALAQSRVEQMRGLGEDLLASLDA